MNNIIGRKMIHYKTIDSTQNEIWRRINFNNIENGTLIYADVQTNGIGTHGRNWCTSSNNIAFSFVIFPDALISKLYNLTVELANIIVEIFEKMYNIELSIKVPNDIMIGTKKIGGILTQTKLKGEQVECVVIGIGINTNKEYFEEEIKDIATSIKNEFGIEVDNKKVILEFCKVFEERFKYLGGEG